MAKLESKKIENALKSLENAAKGAVRALNEMSDNAFAGGPFEKDPLGNVGFIAQTLVQAKEQAKEQQKYEGKDADEIAALQEQERIDEREALQKSVQERLAKRQPKQPETDEIAEEVDETEEPDDTEVNKNKKIGDEGDDVAS